MWWLIEGDLLVKNNLLALLIHIFCVIIFALISIPIQDKLQFVGVISIILLVLYVFGGTMLEPRESKLKNLLSISSIGIIGLFLYGVGLISFGFKAIYIFYTVNIASLTFIAPGLIPNFLKINAIIHISFALIPTALIWMGLEWKTKKEKTRNT